MHGIINPGMNAASLYQGIYIFKRSASFIISQRLFAAWQEEELIILHLQFLDSMHGSPYLMLKCMVALNKWTCAQ